MKEIRINLYDLLRSIGGALDIAMPMLGKHHRQVAYLSVVLGKKLGLDDLRIKDIILAASIHDIGAFSVDQLSIAESEPLGLNHHAFRGAKLIDSFKPLSKVAKIIKYHHIPFNYGEGNYHQGDAVPYESHIMHFADRICARCKLFYGLGRAQAVEALNKYKDSVFMPEIMQAFAQVMDKDSLWLDIKEGYTEEGFADIVGEAKVGLDDLVEVAYLFSKIIDYRNQFTAKHSVGVAETAQNLAKLVGFSPNEVILMRVAGYLHDLGKLAISNEILEKNGPLTDEEKAVMRSHTYYTYKLLAHVPEFETIAQWAAFHHERLDGKGYPFRIKGKDLCLGARIMAVADVFTAIKEDRPYRKEMPDAKAKEVLNKMVENNALDRKVIDLLIDNFAYIDDLRRTAQEKQYADFIQFNEYSKGLKD